MKKLSRYPALLWTACLVLVSGALYGCKDFLTDAASPQGTLNEETLANRAGVEGSLIAAYRSLDWNTGTGGNWGSAASNWVWGSVPSDDAYKGSEPTDQPPINDVEAYFWSTGDADGYLNEKWRAVYEGVVRANSTIRLLNAVVAANPNEIPAADASSIEGEALFLRAHYHFEAYRMWGNIPYYTETDLDFRKANNADPVAGATAARNAIIADLDAAIALLPATPRNGHIGRVTSFTARAYKGRVQVYGGDFTGAITTLNGVRNDPANPYALEASYDRVWTGFSAFDNGPETILAYQASANDGEPSGNNANYGERLNFPHGGSPFGCCGFHQPSQNLVNFFRVDGAGLPLALSAPTTWNTNNANFTSASAGAVDPRLDWTVGRDGVPYKDWGIHEADWIRSPAYGGTYSAKKQAHEFASGAQSSVGWVNTQLNSVNIHIFRYADMLLLLAEAMVERNTGTDLADAHAIVNQVRARAGARAQGCGFRAENDVDIPIPGCANQSAIAVPINDASITWATYAVGQYGAPGTQAVMRDRVRAERRLELAMEGQRFFDLRRWGVAEATLDAYLTGVGGGSERTRRPYLAAPGVDYQAKNNLYPIPSIQIELSKVGGTPQLRQNDGW